MIQRVHKFTTMSTVSAHDSFKWCQVTMADLTGIQSQQQQSVCGPTTCRSPSHVYT